MSTIASTKGLSQASPLENIKKYRKHANYGLNGFAAGINFLTVANGNLHLSDDYQEGLEWLSSRVTKIATIFSGIINAYISNKGRNLLASLGGLGEIPAALFSDPEGYDHWLYRGGAIGLNNFQAIFSRLGKRDKDGNRTSKKIDEDFKTKDFWNGHIEGLKKIFQEAPHIYKDIFKDPRKNLVSFPHTLFSAASLQIIGTSIAATTGLTTLGAGFRNVGGSLVDLSFMLDKPDGKKKSYIPAGTVWIAAAIIDFIKRFDSISDKFSNLTQLANIFDRAATALFTETNNDAAQNEPQCLQATPQIG